MPRRFLTLCVALGCLLGAAPEPSAQTGMRPLRTADFYRLVEVSDPAVSPDGSRVAYVRTSIVEAENRRQREIWIVGTDGFDEPRRLTGSQHDSWAPRWSPDGRLLAFRSRRSDRVGTWFLDLAAGGEAFPIDGVEGEALFSPDGFWIAYTREVPPTGEAAARSRRDDRYGRLDTDAALVEERFSGRTYDWLRSRRDGAGYLPDPRDPLATPPVELFVVPADGGSARQITRLGVTVRDVAWDPSSNRLAFTADTDERDEHSYERDDLWIAERTGGLHRLSDDEHVHASPAWLDESTLIVRRHLGLDAVIAGGADRGAPVDLYRVDAADGSAVNLTPAWDLRPGPPEIGPAGTLRFAAQSGGQRQLFELDAVGNVRPLTTGRYWRDDFHTATDGSLIAFVRSDTTHPTELYVAAAEGGTETQLTRHNEVLRTQVVLTSGRPLRYASTDGQEIEGWLMLPPGILADDPDFPLILSIHGGPHSAYGERFNFRFQLWATAGYGVLYTNPRGSSGYGEDFLWATWKGWGRLDYEDVMAGVGHVLETRNVDAQRLGVTGYSYGGFLTNWIITHTGRFAAAVSGAGISNWVSDYGTADVPRTKESEFGGPPWQPASGELLWELSPIRHADGVSTPTLFLHGEDDFRVPIEQAEQMYTALRKQQVPGRFVRYPDTGHGGWRPWDQVHRMVEELNWWREHLE